MTLHRTERDTVVAAPAPQVLALLAEVADWPLLLARIVHVEPLAPDGAARLAHVWSLSPRGIDDWVCRVLADPDAGALHVAHVVARPPASALSARWHAEPLAAGRCRLTLSQQFEAIADDPDAVRLLGRLFGATAESDLASLREAARIHAAHPGCRFAFGERVPLESGASPDAAFDFLSRPEKWPEHVPGIASMALREEQPGTQWLEMGVEEPDGSVRAEMTARLCFPGRRLIVQKDVRPRVLLYSHTSSFTVELQADGGAISCRHTVVLDPDAVAAALGPEATLADASDKVRRVVSAESLVTLRRAALAARHPRG
jgi:ribosome-associated toxin RatA of RatAB toxin-antitoxin module